MKKQEKEKLVKRYDDRFQNYGFDPKTLGWFKGRQNLRFKILLSQWELKNSRLLDAGCGFGDLYGYLDERKIRLDYTGIDLNETLILEGKKHFPKANLICMEISKEQIKEKYDFIVSSGIHNYKLDDNWGWIEETFEIFYAKAKVGFAINFLSDRVDYTNEENFYASPEKVLSMAYGYSNRVVLRNDYMPFEFTIFVDKRTSFDPKDAIYA